MRNSSEQPLLDTKSTLSSKLQHLSRPVIPSRIQHSAILTLVALLVANVVLLAISGVTLYSVRTSTQKNVDRCAIKKSYSPAAHTLQYTEVLFEKYAHLTSPFSKKPGPQVDDAWHAQLEGMNIRVSQEWLDIYGVESVAFADGSGFLVQLAVYHELHCLKKLKHWIYREHYYLNYTQPELEEEESHAEHCLELLRSAALCRGDTTLTTFQWGGKDGKRLETEYPIPHQCVDAERVLAWSKEHAVDISDKTILAKPQVGY